MYVYFHVPLFPGSTILFLIQGSPHLCSQDSNPSWVKKTSHSVPTIRLFENRKGFRLPITFRIRVKAQ